MQTTRASTHLSNMLYLNTKMSHFETIRNEKRPLARLW